MQRSLSVSSLAGSEDLPTPVGVDIHRCRHVISVVPVDPNPRCRWRQSRHYRGFYLGISFQSTKRSQINIYSHRTPLAHSERLPLRAPHGEHRIPLACPRSARKTPCLRDCRRRSADIAFHNSRSACSARATPQATPISWNISRDRASVFWAFSTSPLAPRTRP